MKTDLSPTGVGNDMLRALGGEVALFSSGGVEAKVFGIPANREVKQHVHDYDHLSILISGTVILVAGTEVTKLSGLQFVEVKAGVQHTIIAETDALWVCLHNSDRLDV